MKINLKTSVKSVAGLFELLNLSEHSVYKVKVQMRADNPPHNSYLFTGFKNGGYCEVYSNTSGQVTPLNELYSINIIKKIDGRGSLKMHTDLIKKLKKGDRYDLKCSFVNALRDTTRTIELFKDGDYVKLDDVIRLIKKSCI